MVTVSLVLVVLAFALTIASALGKCQLWIPVFLLSLIELIQVLPLK